MKLTERATNFLKKQEYRSDAVKSLDVIESAFLKIGIQPTQELIDFQLDYGGLTIYAGLEPICFEILQGEKVRGVFGHPDKMIKELIFHPAEDNIHIEHFTCADTVYQEYFTIDFEGKYYEGWELKANKFENLIEDLAIYGEINQLGYKNSISEYFGNTKIDFEKVKSELNLADYPQFPQDIIKWGQNKELTLRISNDRINLYAKNEITYEQKDYLKKITNKKDKESVAINDYSTSRSESENPKSSKKSNFMSSLKSIWSKVLT